MTTKRKPLMRLVISAAALSTLPTALQAQATLYGRHENYVITKNIGKGDIRQCWLQRGTEDSILALTLSNKNQYGLAFSVQRDDVPESLMAQIHGTPFPFSKEGPRYQKLFKLVVKRGKDQYFQTGLTASEMEALLKMPFIAIGQLVADPNYRQIGAGHIMKFSDESLRIWHQCVSEL